MGALTRHGGASQKGQSTDLRGRASQDRGVGY